jgi:hypothetical protein
MPTVRENILFNVGSSTRNFIPRKFGPRSESLIYTVIILPFANSTVSRGTLATTLTRDDQAKANTAGLVIRMIDDSTATHEPSGHQLHCAAARDQAPPTSGRMDDEPAINELKDDSKK